MNVTLRLKGTPTLRLRYQPGLVGPAGTITVGTVTTGSAGSSAAITNSGTSQAAVLNFTIPRGDTGATGATGTTGNDGWTPELAVVTDGTRRVQQVVDWFGGDGTKPATGEYVGPTGLVSAIGDASDIRGPAGTATIPDGDKGDITTSAGGDTWAINPNTVTFAKMQDIATARILGRSTAGSGDVEELTGAQSTALLSAFVGDSGSGGTKGLVPAPTTGDAVKFLRGDGTFVTPAVIDRAYAEYTTFSTTSAVIPIDDTIPQDTEGSQILSVSLTPKSVTSRFRIRAEVPCSTVTAAAAAVVAIFRNGSADAIAANWRFDAPGYGGSVIASCEYVPGTISAVTITVRAGVSTTGSGQSIAFNGVGVGRILGGSSRATLIVEELKA